MTCCIDSQGLCAPTGKLTSPEEDDDMWEVDTARSIENTFLFLPCVNHRRTCTRSAH
eukprot:m.198999 g.198999  ORF g.198999 m.198999 type:complete len:57 (-) comp32716_c0_seq2:264-434(-)